MKRFKVYPGYHLYFSTSTIIAWLPVFIEEIYFQIIIDSLSYCTIHKGLYVLGYVIMPTHIHLLTANLESNNLSNIMRDFKHYTSTRIAEELEKSNHCLFLAVTSKAAIGKVTNSNIKYGKMIFIRRLFQAENSLDRN